MKMPGELSKINQFSGPLSGTLSGSLKGFSPTLEGSAIGSFARKGNDAAAGILGNWQAGNAYYKATGIFGASRNGPIAVVGR
jgi:hypothetical protein